MRDVWKLCGRVRSKMALSSLVLGLWDNTNSPITKMHFIITVITTFLHTVCIHEIHQNTVKYCWLVLARMYVRRTYVRVCTYICTCMYVHMM